MPLGSGFGTPLLGVAIDQHPDTDEPSLAPSVDDRLPVVHRSMTTSHGGGPVPLGSGADTPSLGGAATFSEGGLDRPLLKGAGTLSGTGPNTPSPLSDNTPLRGVTLMRSPSPSIDETRSHTPTKTPSVDPTETNGKRAAPGEYKGRSGQSPPAKN